MVAVGAPYFNEQSVRSILGSHWISQFLNIGKSRGAWTSPSFFGTQEVGLRGTNKTIAKVQRRLVDAFEISTLSGHSKLESIRTFCRFTTIVLRHFIDGRNEEAILHYVIALDLLFGDRNAISKSVTSRAAVVAHRGVGLGLPDARKPVEGLYDQRSGYVHAGKPVKPGSVRDAAIVAGVVTRALLRLGTADDDFPASWHKKLDFLLSAEEAGKPQPDEEYSECGVALASELVEWPLTDELGNLGGGALQ